MDTMKLAKSGAIAGAVTPYLLMYVVMPILNVLGGIVPSFSVKLANPGIAINIRESLTGINAGLAGWLMDAFKFTVPESMFMTLLVSAIGGAALFVLGGMLIEAIGQLTGSAVRKTTMTIFAGSIIAAVILGTMGLPPELNITFVNVLLAMLVNAAILAWAYSIIDSKAKIGLVPY